MSNKPINMNKLRQVLKLHYQGQGSKSISKLTGVARNTVKKYILQASIIKLTELEMGKHSDFTLDELFRSMPSETPTDRVHELYEFFRLEDRKMSRRGMTLHQFWKDYVVRHPNGFKITAFYKYYRIWKKRVTPSMHIDHKAGDKMFVDFAGEKLRLVDKQTAEIKEVEVFVAILGASQLTYVEAVDSQKKEEFITACENALHYFGGVPAAIVPDNLKSAVTKTHRYEPQINENFEAFAIHYGMAVLPARAYKPKDKSLVEGAVKITYRRIYVHLSSEPYESLEELNKDIWKYLEIHNKTPMQGLDYSRKQQFEDYERNALQPLPSIRFEIFKLARLTVMKNGYVQLTEDRHYYSVPHQYVSKKIKLIYTVTKVKIFYKYQIIAEHIRLRKRGAFSTNPDHLASEHKFQTEWNPEHFILRAREIHPDVENYISGLLASRQYPEQAYRGCMGILSFAKRVGVDRLAKACRRGHEAGSYGFKTIETILQKGLENYREEHSTRPMPGHNNIRGKEYYK
jgi:transposase